MWRPFVPISSDYDSTLLTHLHLLKLLLRETSELILKHEIVGNKLPLLFAINEMVRSFAVDETARFQDGTNRSLFHSGFK